MTALWTIAVDANPILAALLGGYARTILFDPRFRFLTTAFTIEEVRKHCPTIAGKAGVSADELEQALDLLPLSVLFASTYERQLNTARRLIGHIDPHDVDILALALHFDVSLWTNDEHFFEAHPPIRLLRTRDFVL